MLPVLRRWVTARVHWAGADAGLSLRQYAALSGIRQGASSPGELARLWQVTPAVITGIIDRLERRELVRREPDPDDRRRLRLALTDTGLAASALVERALTEELAAQLPRPRHRSWPSLAVRSISCSGPSPRSKRRLPDRAGMSGGEDLPAWDDDCAYEEDITVKDGLGTRRSHRAPAGREA